MKLSIILPTYNSAIYISQAIKSILDQSFRHYELIIIDDGSTDNTKDIVNSFFDNRIKYIYKEHSGLADTLNFGVKNSKYEWIARMDADDLSHRFRIEKQIEMVHLNPLLDLVSNWYALFDRNLKGVIRVPENSSEIKKKLVLMNSVCLGSALIRKSLIVENGGFSGEVYEDYEFLLRVKNNCNFYNIQRVLYYQRIRKNSLSKNDFERIKEIHYSIQNKYYANLIKAFELDSEVEANYYKGWREFLFGNKNLSRNYWNKLRVISFQFPKALIGYLLSMFPFRYFFHLRKIGFKLNLFYHPLTDKESKKEFYKIVNLNIK